MSDVFLRAAGTDTMTSVPNVFIDSYMKDANGEYVKVYLYLLRCLGDEGMDFSVAGMADALDHTQRDISRALNYWESKGLLRQEYAQDGDLMGICRSIRCSRYCRGSCRSRRGGHLLRRGRIIPIRWMSFSFWARIWMCRRSCA